MDANRLLEAAANAVADNRIANFLGHCEPDARRIIVAAVQNFQEEKPPASLFATPDGQKLCSLAKPQRRRKFCLAGIRQCLVSRLGGEPLAAAVTASGDDGTTTGGGHARTEAVAALADEFGWLIGTLHLF